MIKANTGCKSVNIILAAIAFVALAMTTMTVPAALAVDAAEHDAVIFGYSMSNMEVKDSADLVDGRSGYLGAKVGFFWILFLEFGYGETYYLDEANIGGVQKEIRFRTTGAYYGGGMIIPVRGMRLGVRGQRYRNNKWEQEGKDKLTGDKDPTLSLRGNIDYLSGFGFVQFGQDSWLEIGIRRDIINETDSVLTNSFGPYLQISIPIRESSGGTQ
ncbi:MAG: hypothetical protein OEZ59_09720 [Deltaproteobacteria bacterium]|nr:hypothetical protein [Deltaproteobacteria bacterium]